MSGTPATETNQEDPAFILSSSWEEKKEEDWSEDFLRVVTSPDCEGTANPSSSNSDNNILPDKKCDITQVIEFNLPVSHHSKPQGSIDVENLWTPTSSSENPLPSYIVEARPEDTYILPQSPPEEPAGPSSPSQPTGQYFLLSVPGPDSLPTAVSIPTNSYMKTPPMSPETRFLEKHNIMKWVIDDQDEGDIPELSAGISCPSKSQITVAVTSQPTTESESVTASSIDNLKVEENTHEVKSTPRPRKRYHQPDTSPRATPQKMGRLETSESEFSYVSDSPDLTDDEVSALKYRRMRDLNNEASRRCRDRRRVKQQSLMMDLEEEKNKNLILRNKCDVMESKVRKIKNYILKSFKNPQKEIALANQRRGEDALTLSPESIGIFSDPKDLPEIDCSWLF